mgnify:CR=1 FL=1
MDIFYIYPGTFSPPTLGHVDIICRAAAIFPIVTIVCSKNPNKKDNWFTPEECKELWKSYTLPKNVNVLTLAELKQLKLKTKNIVMVRGLRDLDDYEQEKEVMTLNFKHFGVDKYFYIFSQKKYKNISSSKVRQEVMNLKLKELNKQVSSLIIKALLEKRRVKCLLYLKKS